MRSKRFRRTPLSVTLFPFLAVLICTLGVLIVLLVLAVRAADVQASQDQAELEEIQQAQKSERRRKEFELDEKSLKLEFLTDARPELVEQLSKAREYRGHLEAELRRLKTQMQTLAQSLQEIQNSDPVGSNDDDADQLAQQIDALRQKQQAAKQELESRKQQALENQEKKYSIVPHSGSGGTFRRPIFIEATKQTLILQPLGIRLDRNDFAPPFGPGNPLDAALLAIRDYWIEHDINQTEGSPYPLIVIRPDGAEGYAIARHAMVSWEDEYGYEMIEADKNLDFGTVDPQLQKLVKDVVDEAKSKQRTLLASRTSQQQLASAKMTSPSGMQGNRRSEQRPGLTASGSAGGFVINSAGQNTDRFANPFAGADSPNQGFGRDGNLNSATDSPLQSGRTSENLLLSGGRGEGSENDFSTTPSSLAQLGKGNENSSSPTLGSLGAMSASTSAGSPGGEGQYNIPIKLSADTSGPPDGSPDYMYQHLNLAQTRGNNWALPTQSANQTGYVRPIRVVCSAEQLEIRSPLGVEKRIPIGESIDDAVDPLINEIWRQIESWGLPGAKSYWKPELRISVLPGGELNFEKLQGLLFNSGVEIQEAD